MSEVQKRISPGPSDRGDFAAATRRETNAEAVGRLHRDAETRAALLENAVRHVLRYGKLGKQSEARLQAALRAVEVSRG